MAKKNERELKVCAQSGYNYKSVPAIRLMGQWLEAAGFHIGDPVLSSARMVSSSSAWTLQERS